MKMVCLITIVEAEIINLICYSLFCIFEDPCDLSVCEYPTDRQIFNTKKHFRPYTTLERCPIVAL